MNKRYLLILGVVLVIFVAPLIIDILVSKGVRSAMSDVLASVDPATISDDTARSKVHCERPKLEKVCQELYIYQKEGTSGNLKATLSNQDIEAYINELTIRLRKEGWKEYQFRHDDYPPEAFPDRDVSIKTLYFIHSKRFGRTECEVLTNYSSKDPVTNLSPSMYQKISCQQISI